MYSVRNNPGKSRFEVEVDGHLCISTYLITGNTMTFLHTEVPNALRGRGIAGHLTRFALDQARKDNLKIISRCDYVTIWIRRHPEYEKLLA